MVHGITIEICAGSFTDALTAERFPVDRIELNSALELGGLTPSLHTFLSAKANCTKRIICMVRPRPAGFVYSLQETEIMFRDAEEFLDHGADGIVFGFLNPDHTVEKTLTSRMVSLIHRFKAEAVFHKAFDETPDPFQAMQDLVDCGVDRVLTSGQKPDVPQGAELIHSLIHQDGDRIQILPGGGVNEHNIAAVLKETGTAQIHFSAKTSLQDCGSYFAVSAAKINAILTAMKPVADLNGRHEQLSGEDIEMLDQEPYEEAISPAGMDDDRDH